jgi:hypothetical protein
MRKRSTSSIARSVRTSFDFTFVNFVSPIDLPRTERQIQVSEVGMKRMAGVESSTKGNVVDNSEFVCAALTILYTRFHDVERKGFIST